MDLESDSGEEIIFNYAAMDEALKNVKTPTTSQTVAQEPVDLEIILLGPKSRRPNNFRRIKRDRGLRFGSSRSEKSIDLREFDPFASDIDEYKKKDVVADETKSTISESGLTPEDEGENGESRSEATDTTNMSNSNKQRPSGSNKSKDKPKKSPTIDGNLLDKMERRYRGNRVPKADDGLHIDYMDYF